MLRLLYREAASIENLSPNGSAFLARRILEQSLREHLRKPRAKLVDLIGDFLEHEVASDTLHRRMHDVREFGNIAAHPSRDQQGEWTIVDAAEASYTLDVVAELLDHLYVRPKHRQAMRDRWQAKKRGEHPQSDQPNKVILGGREITAPSPASDDDIPF